STMQASHTPWSFVDPNNSPFAPRSPMMPDADAIVSDAVRQDSAGDSSTTTMAAFWSDRREWRPAWAVKEVGRRFRRRAMNRTVTVVALLVLAAVHLLVGPMQVSAGSSTDAPVA